MDESEDTHKSEEPQEAEEETAIDNSEQETANYEEDSADPEKKTHEDEEEEDDNDQKKIRPEPVAEELKEEEEEEEEKVGAESASETEPLNEDEEEALPSKTEQPLDEKNGFFGDPASKNIDLLPDPNGLLSPILPNVEAKGIDKPSEENGVSSVLQEYVPRENDEVKLPASHENPGEPSPQVSEITDNQAFVATTPRVMQRSYWKGCCGLLEVLRRSDG